MMIRFTRHVIAHPWRYVGLTLVITLVLGYQLQYMQMDPDVTDALPQKIPAKRLYDKMGEIFPTKEFIFIGMEGDDIFSRESLEDVWEITARFESLPAIYDVMSPTNVSLILGTEEGMEVRDILSAPPQTPVEIETFQRDLFSSDLALGNLVSRDSTMMGMMILLKNTTDANDFIETFIPLVEELDAATELDLILAGKAVASHYVSEGMQKDMSTFFMGGLVLIFVLMLVIFRTLRGILVPLGVVIMSVIWTLGAMVLLGFPMSHATEVMPILIMSIAVADSIHIIAHYYANARGEQDRKNLVVRTMEHMNSPVIMTSLTTMAGFSALGVSSFEESAKLGFFTALGVFFAMLISISFVPAVFSLLPIPRILAKRNHRQPLDARVAVAWGQLLVRYSKGLYPLVGLVVLVSAWGISRLEHSYSSIENFAPDHPVRTAYDRVNEHFAGTTSFQVMIEGREGDMIKEPRILQDMDDLKAEALNYERVGDVVSLADFVKRINKVLNGDREEYYAIPAEKALVTYMDWEQRGDQWVEVEKTDTVSGKELVAQYMALYEMSGKPEDLANLVDYDYRNAKLSVFMDTDDMNTARELDRRLSAFITDHFEGAEVAITGMAKLFLVVDGLIVSGQITSISVSLFLVWLITTFMFRSPLIGLFSALPLFFALLLNFTIMGLSNIHVNLETMMTSSIAIGVGVDYAIHFIYTYRRRLGREGSFAHAVPATMEDSGVAIAYNSFVVAAGFSIITLSQFVSIQRMGLLITITMLTAAFGALTILPLVFNNFRPKVLRLPAGKPGTRAEPEGSTTYEGQDA
ncbi:MAG: RND family transporter [Fidelibacterota bacterium]|nr:MAG: RND family transporter [Candidatus Neomarinimicrobiota bacterium]